MPASATLPARVDTRTGARRKAPDTAGIVAALELELAQTGAIHADAFRTLGKLKDPTSAQLASASALSGSLRLAAYHQRKALQHARELGGDA